MILTTTPQIEGHTIREYKGVVTRASSAVMMVFLFIVLFVYSSG